ncbi:Sugar phosphate isomerase/epimerase [Candidatus Pantoea symbiotica]|jgi:sugar phosphate isomerase/epimerase|uniref:Sugar phosphate isomerase/epimerase n=1 Tax=Candidatus Pantoea symbiotica TaxID=1884370 RepID=A0A1I3Z4Q3_9GAMM|nr:MULTISPECIES: sugar phosphate isomerase/epimerase family protein [Pantoea]KAJ9430672.1 sugar phosphate isomerase/epimerase family protein [Pantoea sp. YR343]MRT25986.1 TIM barrel protein [Enterobacteriaceae bacterium RIT697]SFK39045.1 Sugar phosphate isomerase/epimerase [Pantoea symbiotica]SFU88947.1 Sugar phosphate isomerase/epimerase [Pantoea sp. YR525]
MKLSLHGVSVWYSNAVTQLRIAHETGFSGLEILPEHLYRYLENGGSYAAYRELMAKYSVDITCINALKRIGRHEPQARAELLHEAEKICQAAVELRCPVVQIMALTELDHLSAAERDAILLENISAIADIGAPHGIKFQIEVVAFTAFNSLQHALDLIKQSGKDNLGVVVDFWHLHAGGGTTPAEVARMDKDLIYGVHFCDGRAAKPGEAWDEWVQRDYAPGEGDVDIAAWVAAVKATGYDGVWSPELLSPQNWEDDLWDISRHCYEDMNKYIH